MNIVKFMAYLAICLIVGLTATASTNTIRTSPPIPNTREAATISITLDGLMALCLDDSKRVSVGIMDVVHHTPKLTINRIHGQQKTTVAELTGK